MASVADRLRALSADDKTLAKRMVRARQAQALLAELEPKLAAAAEQEAEAATRLAAAKAAMERTHKEKSGMRGLFLNKQKKAQINTLQMEAMLDHTQAFRDRDAAQRQLKALRAEKAALDRDVGLLRTGDAATRARTVALLDAVFDGGPAPDFPAYASLHEQYAAAKAAYDAVQGRVAQSAAVVNNLSRASGDLRGAIQNLQDAVVLAERDAAEQERPDITKIFAWGHHAWKADKQVEYAKQRIESAEAVFAEARKTDPAVGDAFQPAADEPADGDWTQKPITSYLARRGVSVPILQECLEKVLQEVESGSDRTNALAKKERDPALQRYNELEDELKDLRGKILEEVSQGTL